MKKIGVIVAMGSEFELVAALLENKTERKINGLLFLEGESAGKTIVLGRSGIGKVCAAVGTLEMIRNYAPDCIINTGVAGGIDVSLQVADVVAGERMVYHDVWCGEGNAYGQIQGFPLYFHSDASLLEAVKNITGETGLKRGMICSGDKFITDRTELQDIKEKFPEALAVDMESCSMAQVCHMYNIPFLSLRIISDTPGVEEHGKQYADFWKKAPEKSFGVFKKLLNNI